MNVTRKYIIIDKFVNELKTKGEIIMSNIDDEDEIELYEDRNGKKVEWCELDDEEQDYYKSDTNLEMMAYISSGYGFDYEPSDPDDPYDGGKVY